MAEDQSHRIATDQEVEDLIQELAETKKHTAVIAFIFRHMDRLHAKIDELEKELEARA